MTRDYYLKHRLEIGAKSKIYRENNKEKIALQKKKDHEKNRDRDLERAKRHYENNKEDYIVRAKKQYESDKESHVKLGREWIKNNPEKRRASVRKYNRKYRSTPKGNISSTISKRMNESLQKGMKAGRHWEELVNFTIDELKKHIEKLFTPEMTWENYGTYWHIDHKVPIAVFNFERPDDIDFHLCWSLKNLQPLEASKNMSKGAKLSVSFQPSLAM